MTSQRQSPEKEQEKIPGRKKANQYLKSHIQSGKLNSGQRLNKEILAETLEISRTPVREALHLREGISRNFKRAFQNHRSFAIGIGWAGAEGSCDSHFFWN